MPILTNIKVRISLLKVDSKWCSFNYKIWVNGKLNTEGHYSDDHVWGDRFKSFRTILENGYATQLALEHVGKIRFNKKLADPDI